MVFKTKHGECKSQLNDQINLVLSNENDSPYLLRIPYEITRRFQKQTNNQIK